MNGRIWGTCPNYGTPWFLSVVLSILCCKVGHFWPLTSYHNSGITSVSCACVTGIPLFQHTRNRGTLSKQGCSQSPSTPIIPVKWVIRPSLFYCGTKYPVTFYIYLDYIHPWNQVLYTYTPIQQFIVPKIYTSNLPVHFITVPLTITTSVCRGRAQKEGKMSYTEFVWFLMSEEDKRSPTRYFTLRVNKFTVACLKTNKSC